eukprot:786228-Pelagomonas_calceolata.AAC.1
MKNPHPTREYGDSGGVAAPLLGQSLIQGQELFNYGPRKWQDTRWLVTYVLFLVLSIAGGVYATLHSTLRHHAAFCSEKMLLEAA